MTYEKYLDYSREELLEKIRAVMSLNASIMFWVLSELLLLLLKSTDMIQRKLAFGWFAFMIMPRNFQIRNSWSLSISMSLILH